MADETVIIRTPTPDDEIVLSLVEQKMVTHETVRVSVTVNAQRPDGTGEDDLRRNIKNVLRKFVDAEWRFLSINRNQGQTRFEQISVNAIARVPEAQNMQLKERADAVSTPGLELIAPRATYALPFDQVQKINSALRVALTQQAQKECDAHNEHKPGTKYRVASIEFADTPRQAGTMRAGTAYQGRAGGSAGYEAAHIATALAGADEDAAEGGVDFGTTERFWVAAVVTLRAKHA